jgi:Fur family transcriptional regulator, ferric uptake regulator
LSPRPDDRLRRVLALVREKGGRVTTTRRAIIAALLDAPDHHVTAQTLAERVQAAHPDIHASTVYRTLDTLTELGVVEHTHLGHGATVYHLTDERHQHLVCEECGAVVEVPLAAFDPLVTDLRATYGFEVHPEHVALVGRCRACSSSASDGEGGAHHEEQSAAGHEHGGADR